MIRTLTLAAVLPLLSLSILPACSTAGDGEDELAGEADDNLAGKADSGGTYTYFAISQDTRKCSSPSCGGFFIDRLNSRKTTCHDGASRTKCYTPVLDWSETSLTPSQQDALVSAAGRGVASEGVYAIVRGRFVKKNTETPIPKLGKFIVTEAWVAQGDGVSDGVFAKVKDNGVRCITTPCPSTGEYALNASRSANIAEVDFSAGDLSDAAIEALSNDAFTASGYIVAGDRYTFKSNGQKAKGRTATNAYRNLANVKTADACFVGGCSSQICSDQEGVISTCEFRAEYACYHEATCERQTTGTCGWTQTAELQACLANPPQL